MNTLFFVHGTGVRDDGYQKTLGRIRQGMIDQGRKDLEVVGVSWGKLTGVNVTPTEIDLILPPAAAKGLGGSDEEIRAELWSQLLDDPLFELRLAPLGNRPQPGGSRWALGLAPDRYKTSS